jgi:prevent-host-death family protein
VSCDRELHRLTQKPGDKAVQLSVGAGIVPNNREAEYMSWMFNNLYISKLFLYIIAMKELSVTEAREQFPALLNQAAKKPVWITRHGVDVAVVISPELFEELVSAQEELEDIAAVDEAMLDKSPGIPWEQVQKDLKLI